MSKPFVNREPSVTDNPNVRIPQLNTYVKLKEFADSGSDEREVGIILPVGCGKSGCITLAPFAFKSNRTLVIAPNLAIAKQLANDFDPTNERMFYQKCAILDGTPYPEPVEIRGTTTNQGDLEEADVVITNIQQLQGGEENRWLQTLPQDFFDLILFDEGHHSVAESWTLLKARFPEAKIVNFSATPLRADGQVMGGRVIYSYPVAEAIQAGYVKRLKAIQLNPSTLRYVRREDGQEIEVNLEEVRQLGEQDADFRRSIVTSNETLITIVDTSIRALRRLREETGNSNLKIIASALNYQHCLQIVEAYTSRGQRAGYVHSREDSKVNQRVLQKLENHELDVIVQVRKLGEGFDHPYLSVAAVFSIFNNLSPFIQFVGRIMRVIRQNAPEDSLNQGIVVFHAGANIARQWADFKRYSEADQAYFDDLLPVEGFDPGSTVQEREIDPTPRDPSQVEVKFQSEIILEEIPLIDTEELEAIRLLKERGLIPNSFDPASQTLQPIPTTKVKERQAMRFTLADGAMIEARRILAEKKINPNGYELDKNKLGRTNLIIMKAAIDRHINKSAGVSSGKRSELSRAQLEQINLSFDQILESAINDVFK